MRRSHALIKAYQAWRVNGWAVNRSGLSPGVLTLPYSVTCKGLCTAVSLCVRTFSWSTVSASFCDVLWVLCTLPGVWCWCVGASSLEISLLCHLYSREILYWLLKSLWHFPIWLPPELSAVFGVGLHLHCLGLRVSSSRRNDLLVTLFCI